MKFLFAIDVYPCLCELKFEATVLFYRLKLKVMFSLYFLFNFHNNSAVHLLTIFSRLNML